VSSPTISTIISGSAMIRLNEKIIIRNYIILEAMLKSLEKIQ
jgi:hypothetical protein